MKTKMLTGIVCVLFIAGLVAGCDEEIMYGDGDAGDGDGDADQDSISDDQPGDEIEPDESGSQDCNTLRQALAAKVQRGASMECTGVVRLSYSDLKPLGWKVFCADKAAGGKVDETAARANAGRDLALGGPETGRLLAEPSAPTFEAYVFYQPAGDFGRASAVNSRNGLTLFGGSIIWMGSGEILYPQDWGAPAELGAGCLSSLITLTQVRSFDLSTSDAGPIANIDPVINAVLDTVMPAALQEGTAAYLKNTLVLLYPRSVGAMDPATAEYLVFINAGWE